MRAIGRILGLMVATVLITLTVQHVLAVTAGTANLGAKTIAVVSGGPNSIDTESAFANIPGASVTLTVPQKQTGLILARFSGESICNQGAAGAECRIALLIQGPGLPSNGVTLTGYADRFDADDTGDNYSEAHATQGWRGGLGAGTYTIRAQYLAGPGTNVFTLRSWTLTAEYWRSA